MNLSNVVIALSIHHYVFALQMKIPFLLFDKYNISSHQVLSLELTMTQFN